MGRIPSFYGQPRLFLSLTGVSCVATCSRFFCNRLPRLFGGGVATDVTDELLAQGVFDLGRMHALNQHAGGKFAKRSAYGGLVWQCKAQIKPATDGKACYSLECGPSAHA